MAHEIDLHRRHRQLVVLLAYCTKRVKQHGSDACALFYFVVFVETLRSYDCFVGRKKWQLECGEGGDFVLPGELAARQRS